MKTFLLLLLLPTLAFAGLGRGEHHRSPNSTPNILPAKDARELLEMEVYNKHKEAINWWVETINTRILEENRKMNASVLIDLGDVSPEVQNYLQKVYELAGYRSEFQILVEGHWMDKKVHHHLFLGLSW